MRDKKTLFHKVLVYGVLPVLFISPLTASAYTLLAPIFGTTNVATLADYFGIIFSLVLGIASVGAVVMLVIAGLQYIASGANESLRGAAKERIRNALFGLILALGAWVLLNAINPDLIGFGNAGGGLGSGNIGSTLPSALNGGIETNNVAPPQYCYFRRSSASASWTLGSCHDDLTSCQSASNLSATAGGNQVSGCQMTFGDPVAPASGGGSSAPTTHWCFKFRAQGSTSDGENCNNTTLPGCQNSISAYPPPAFTITQGCYSKTI